MSYRFIWPRDQVVMTQALAAAGAEADVRRALAWFEEHRIADAVDDRGIDRTGTWWQNYYATGEPHWRSLQLDQVGGPRRSGPVGRVPRGDRPCLPVPAGREQGDERSHERPPDHVPEERGGPEVRDHRWNADEVEPHAHDDARGEQPQ